MAALELGLIDGDFFADEHVDAIETAINVSDPPLAVIWTASATAPTGWFLVNGQTVVSAQSLYPDAWAVAPASWKSGSSLVLPNLANRTILGAGTTSLGSTGGANTRTLTTANMPSHTHTIDHDHGSASTSSNGDHNHGVSGGGGFLVNNGGAFTLQSPGPAYYTSEVPATTTAGAHTHTFDMPAFSGASGSNGSGTAVDTTPAHLALTAIIRLY